MCDETPQERQDNELAALKSIFGDDVVDNHEAIAWKIWRPLDILITLRPLHNSQDPTVHCSITLRFQCPHNYPEKPPDITVHKSDNLSNENEAKLLYQLEKLSIELCGEVMIYQLAHHTEQFLHEHNKPSLSFYDQMVQQKIEMEKLKLLYQQEKENEERQKIKDEIQRRQEILREADKKTDTEHEAENNEGQGDAPKLVYYADNKMSPAKRSIRSNSKEVPCTCDSRRVHTLRITQMNSKKVYIGKCLGHSSNGSTTSHALDDETGDHLITKKWTIPPHSDFQLRTRQMTSLQQDLKVTCRIKHKNLVPYVAIEIPKEINRLASPKHSVYVFRDFVLGTSLKVLKDKMPGIFIKNKYQASRLLKRIGLGVLSALHELHSVNVLHRDIRSENVFLDDAGTVKLVGVALDWRLTEICEGADYYCERQTRAQDIYSTGQMLLSLICPSGSTNEIPQDLPCNAKDFFSRCLTDDEQSQWSAEQLLHHEFLNNAPTVQPSRIQRLVEESSSEDEETGKQLFTHIFPINRLSRLNEEFEIQKKLGSGAFGDALKVKNKLDDRFYVIKRIQLNPENVQLNKKIAREVKLLSQLTHHNVVRYYNAWIESAVWDVNCEESTSTVPSANKKKPSNSIENIVAKLGGGVKLEWSISEKPVQRSNTSSDSEDDEDISVRDGEESFDLEESYFDFARDPEDESRSIPSPTQKTPQSKTERIKYVLYIQMEFCEKNTLRQAIDNNLCDDIFRAWRLFREICEGLAHIHQRGMIHRDLKPVNIFLDSNDHVKIGDFGLATKAYNMISLDDKANKHSADPGGQLTGQIGTALYVAPELMEENAQVLYNQKVDIYSLGIILFEMFHKPFDTSMERISVLKKVREKAIVLPKEFEENSDNAKQIYVIRWLLNHDPSLRPTCAEMLASEHIARPVPEGGLSRLLCYAMNDRKSRGYQIVVTTCFEQKISPAEDFTYQQGMKGKPLELLSALKDVLVKVFRSHGATEFAPPLMTPRAYRWDQYPNAVKVMTESGFVCHLPHDLRLPFARYIAHTETKYMRRYVVGNVFRERHVKEGFHPKEMVECAFDIVTPKVGSLWTDAELLVVASRAASACEVKVQIKLNHTKLLSTLLESCGVPEDKQVDIHRVLVEVSCGRITNLQLQTHLTSLCVTPRDVTNLLEIMEIDHPVSELKGLVCSKVNQDKWGQIVDEAINDLENVVANATALGCECPMSVKPFMASNATQHSGVFWLMSVQREDSFANPEKPVKQRPGDLIAAGGRYDLLVSEFLKVATTKRDISEQRCSSVGFSLSLERIAAILKKNEIIPAFAQNTENPLICVCMSGSSDNSKERQTATRRAQIAKELWANGFNCCALDATAGDAQELSGASVVLEHDEMFVRVIWGMDSVGYLIREHRVPYTEVVDFLKRKFNHPTVKSAEATGGGPSRSMSWCDDRTISPTVCVHYTASEKITKTTKRYCEIQINTYIATTLSALGMNNARIRVQVLALALEAPAVRSLAAHLNVPLDCNDLPQAFREVSAQYMKRQNILNDALEVLTSLVKNPSRYNDETVLYAVYSIPDCMCRMIV